MHNRGQSIVEYALIAILVLTGIVLMGGYVLRSVDAHFKLWDEGAQDSFTENINQASLNAIPAIPSNCQCTQTKESCGLATGTLCGLGMREVDNECTPPGCDGKAALSNCSIPNDFCSCVPDPTCCATPVNGGCTGSTAPIPPAGLPAGSACPADFYKSPVNLLSSQNCITPPAATPYNCYYGTEAWSYQCGPNTSVYCVVPTSVPASCQPQCLGTTITGQQIQCPGSGIGLSQSMSWQPVANLAACPSSPNCNYYSVCSSYTSATPGVSPPTNPVTPSEGGVVYSVVCGKDSSGTDDTWCPTGDTCKCSGGGAPNGQGKCLSGQTYQCDTTPQSPKPPSGTTTECTDSTGDTVWCPTGDICSAKKCYANKVSPNSGNCPGSGYCPVSPKTKCCSSTETCIASSCYTSDTGLACPATGCGPSGGSPCTCGSSCCPSGYSCNSNNNCVTVSGPTSCADTSELDCGTAGCCPLMTGVQVTGPNGTVIPVTESCYNKGSVTTPNYKCYAPIQILASGKAKIEVWGGGGGGGGSNPDSNDGGGGGGGGWAQTTSVNVASSLLIYPGKGGAGNSSAATGQTGEISFVIVDDGNSKTGALDTSGDLYATGGLGGVSGSGTSNQIGGHGGSGYNGDVVQVGHAGGSMGATTFKNSQCGGDPATGDICYNKNKALVPDNTCSSECACNDTCCNGGDSWNGNGGAAGGVYGASPFSSELNCRSLTFTTAKGVIYNLHNISSCVDGIINNHASSKDSSCAAGIDFIPPAGRQLSPNDQSGSLGFTPGCGGSSGRASDVSGNGGSGDVLVCWQQ